MHACSASLPDPATLTQPDAVPSQQYGSTVAFAASSRIEAFPLWQVWAVGWCLVGPPPKAQIKFGGGFRGPTHTPPELAKLHRRRSVQLWGGRSCGAADHPAQAVRIQQAPVEPSKDHPRNVAALSLVSTFSPSTTHATYLKYSTSSYPAAKALCFRQGEETSLQPCFCPIKEKGTSHRGACMMQETNTTIQTAGVEAVGRLRRHLSPNDLAALIVWLLFQDRTIPSRY